MSARGTCGWRTEEATGALATRCSAQEAHAAAPVHVLPLTHHPAPRCRPTQIPLGKFIITKQLTKRPEDYPDAKNQPHVQVGEGGGAESEGLQFADEMPCVTCLSLLHSLALRHMPHGGLPPVSIVLCCYLFTCLCWHIHGFRPTCRVLPCLSAGGAAAEGGWKARRRAAGERRARLRWTDGFRG